MSGTTSGTEDEIRELQERFDRAELEGDAGTLGELLADDFASIGPKGFLMDKQQWIARHGHFRYDALDVEALDVRVYDGSAIVRNVQRNRATWQEREVAMSVRVSQTWVRQGRWRLAGIQFSPLDEG
jgi:hypothetical protein